jgi:NAD(P)-dependent dehydrogenase (short-subunit alcohol dehydrogenase family)
MAGRVVLVTGSGGGIGRVLAAAFFEAGATVALHDRTPEDLVLAGQLLESTDSTSGGSFKTFVADLASVEACRGLIEDVASAFGRLDVLVNCAAANRREAVDVVTPETFDWLVAVDVRAPFFLSQAAARHMRKQGGGKIINVGSINSQYALDTVAVYGLCKGAITQMTKEMAVEFAPYNIQVNCLTPGFIITPMNESSLWGVERKRDWILGRVPAGRPGLPEDLVGATLLMASDAGSFLTGQSIAVDGGFTAGGSWEYQR